MPVDKYLFRAPATCRIHGVGIARSMLSVMPSSSDRVIRVAGLDCTEFSGTISTGWKAGVACAGDFRATAVLCCSFRFHLLNVENPIFCSSQNILIGRPDWTCCSMMADHCSADRLMCLLIMIASSVFWNLKHLSLKYHWQHVRDAPLTYQIDSL